MKVTQLDPLLPVHTPKGQGYAFLVIDYSQEHYLHFAVALDDDGTIHIMDNREVRFQWNRTMGRLKPEGPQPA